MPTPAISIWTLSLPLILIYQYSPFLESLFLISYFLLGFTLLVSVLMNVELRLFALKFNSWPCAVIKIRDSFLIISAISIVVWKFIAISIILTLYISLSL